MHHGKMHFQSIIRWPVGNALQPPRLYVPAQIEPDALHVSNNLLRRFLERKVNASLAPFACRGKHATRQARLSRARSARNQNRRVTIESLAAEHGVDLRRPTRHELARRWKLQSQRCDRNYGYPVRVNQERVFIRSMRAAAILHDPKPAR